MKLLDFSMYELDSKSLILGLTRTEWDMLLRSEGRLATRVTEWVPLSSRSGYCQRLQP